ncbi:MAG TPA: hypothetical protein VGO79_11450 [Thermoanaerobaculia bacterium]|jgi:hypothetical protein
MTETPVRLSALSDATEGDDPIVVYRTSALHEADIVAEALERAHIPFFRRVETLGGLSFAMPVNPPPGMLPGNFWSIAVPGKWVRRTARFIAKLPVTQQLPATHLMPGVRDVFRGWTWLFVLAILLAMAWTIFRMYTS